MTVEAFARRLRSVDRAMLIPLVSRALQTEVSDLAAWDYQPMLGGFSQEHGLSYGVYRFRGTAETQRGTTPWSLILKATSATLAGSQEPTAFDYWKREPLVYKSGLLADLPGGLAIPRCLGVETYADEEEWLWLEDVTDLEDELWPFARYRQVARHLGHFNGTFAAPNRMPNVPWLSEGDFHHRLALAASGITQLPALSQHPYFRALLPDNFAERMVHLWEARTRLLHVRDALPTTLCHHDAFRRNLLIRLDAEGVQQTVLIDWAKAGTGVLGEELVALFAVTLKFIEIDCDRLPELDAEIFANYIDGLRAAGWQGDPQAVRFGFTATAALKCGVAEQATKLPNIARRIANLPLGTDLPQILGPGLEQSVALHRYLLHMGDEALALASVVNPH